MVYGYRYFRIYNHNEIINLYESVGWVNYVEHPERLREGYKNSLCVLAAYKDTELAGILRTVGDNATILFIQDIIVLPKYQRMGIGTKLIKSAMEKYPVYNGIRCSTRPDCISEEILGLLKSCGRTRRSSTWSFPERWSGFPSTASAGRRSAGTTSPSTKPRTTPQK